MRSATPQQVNLAIFLIALTIGIFTYVVNSKIFKSPNDPGNAVVSTIIVWVALIVMIVVNKVL